MDTFGRFLKDRLFGGSSPNYEYIINGSGGNGYTYQNPQIYGPSGYTAGQTNRMTTYRTGLISNYQGYSTNYWRCVNEYRGNYYYSYNFGDYVCDTRPNQNGK